MNDSDDYDTQLSAHSLAVLQEFYLDQQQKKQFAECNNYFVGSIEENWQLSQFWYSDETAQRLAQEAIEAAGRGSRCSYGRPGSKLTFSENVSISPRAQQFGKCILLLHKLHVWIRFVHYTLMS